MGHFQSPWTLRLRDIGEKASRADRFGPTSVHRRKATCTRESRTVVSFAWEKSGERALNPQSWTFLPKDPQPCTHSPTIRIQGRGSEVRICSLFKLKAWFQVPISLHVACSSLQIPNPPQTHTVSTIHIRILSICSLACARLFVVPHLA